MNEKFYLGTADENLEVESRMIETNVTPSRSINDLTESEKAEFYGVEVDFSMSDAFEMTR